MRIVEEGYLKRTVSQLNRYAVGQDTYDAFYASIASLASEPLQDLSFRSDLSYFDEMSFVLSVITSIISHPHISTENEDIILRTEFANMVSADTFQETLRDPGLWKQEGRRMIPEYVHYHQSVDDLCIYENQFVVMLVKLLTAEVGKYSDFYASLIETFSGQEQLSLDGENVSVALEKIGKLSKKLRYIQNTRFYKTINKKYTTLRTVHPTNILLKDRLYNHCFKFYRSLITYPDRESLMRDFSLHYYMLLLRALQKRGFQSGGESGTLQFDQNGSLIPAPMTMENDFYRVHFEMYHATRGIELTVEHKIAKLRRGVHVKHLLLFSPQSSFADLSEEAHEAGYTTVEGISLWNMTYLDGRNSGTPVYRNPLSEQGVMDEWLSQKLSSSRVSFALYRTFCPVCQKQAVNPDERDVRTCAKCSSQFVFFKDRDDQENLWFLKLRRPGHGKKQ